jgi:hypothetical protein
MIVATPISNNIHIECMCMRCKMHEKATFFSSLNIPIGGLLCACVFFYGAHTFYTCESHYKCTCFLVLGLHRGRVTAEKRTAIVAGRGKGGKEKFVGATLRSAVYNTFSSFSPPNPHRPATFLRSTVVFLTPSEIVH